MISTKKLQEAFEKKWESISGHFPKNMKEEIKEKTSQRLKNIYFFYFASFASIISLNCSKDAAPPKNSSPTKNAGVPPIPNSAAV